MYRVIIYNDENSVCNQLEEDIYLYGRKNHKIFDIDICCSGKELLKQLNIQERYDFIILDNCLKDMTGIEIGKKIRSENENYDIPIIYMSAFQNFAFPIFKIRPFDLLLKPIKKEELFSVLDEVCKELNNRKQFFIYKQGTSYFHIPYESIMYFYSVNKKVFIATLGLGCQKTHLLISDFVCTLKI